MGLLNRYEKIRMDKNAILKAESRNRSGGKKRMNRTIRVSAAGAVLTFPLRNSGGLSECATVFRNLSGEMHTSGASAGRAWYGQGKRRKNIPYVADEKTAEKIAEYLTRVSKRYGTEWEYKEGRIVLHA